MTTPQTQNTNQQQEPFFPPWVLLAVAAVGIFVVVAVLMTQSEFTVVGWAGLLVGIIATFAWAVMNPREIGNFVRGRGLSFGGTAIVVVAVLVIAAVLVYALIEAQNWSIDFTENNQFSLAENTRDVLEALGNDPTTPPVRFVAFYEGAAGAERDRVQLLLEDFEEASKGKVTFQFVDPNREPLVAQQYGENIRSGQIAVVLLDEAGNPIIDEPEIVTGADQYQLTNTIITVLAAGDFRAVVLNVSDGADPSDSGSQGSSDWVTRLRDGLKWTVEIKTPLELASGAGLGTPAADGDVLIIPGGAAALPDEAITTIANYLDNGGTLILLARHSLTAEPGLASAENMSALLQERFGVRVRNDLVLDAPTHFNAQGLQLLVENYESHPITEEAQTNNLLTVLLPAQSLEIADTPPDNVTVTVLMRTTDDGYAKAGLDIQALLADNPTVEEFEQQLVKADSDIAGALPVGIAAENSATGARLVVFGSDALIWNGFDGSRLEANPYVMQRAIFWATRFDDFAAALSTVQPVEQVPPDEVVITPADVNYFQFVTMFLIPFGALLLGVVVWWVRRERVNG